METTERCDMMDMMGGMGIMLLIGVLLLAVVIGVAVYLGTRAARSGGPSEPTAREMLQQRLARGEIPPAEYYEREAALGDRDTSVRRRR